MDKLDLRVVAIKKDRLFADTGEFFGFRAHTECDYARLIMVDGELVVRRHAESDLSYKQPICHIAVVNSQRRELFAFQRASRSADYTEERLFGKWSLGIGGHMDEEDMRSDNPLAAAVTRELGEEVLLTNAGEPQLYGYINEKAVPVDLYHFGVLFFLEADRIQTQETSFSHGQFYPLKTLQEICASTPAQMESWSLPMLEPLQQYFENGL